MVHCSFCGRPTGHGPTLRVAGCHRTEPRSPFDHPPIYRRSPPERQECAAEYVRPAGGARTPSTFICLAPGPPAHCRRADRPAWFTYAETRRTGNSGRRPRTIRRTPDRAKGPRRRSRSEVTSRATMSDRPRAVDRVRRGLIAASASSPIASRPTGGRSSRPLGSYVAAAILALVPGPTSRRPEQGRSCDRAIRARRPSREAADRPADQAPQPQR